MNASPPPLTPSKPPAVWLGDAVRVLNRLGVSGDLAARVLVLLGMLAPPATETGPGTPGRRVRPPTLPPPPPGRPSPGPTVREVLNTQTPAAGPAERPLVEQVPPDPRRGVVAPRQLPTVDEVLGEEPDDEPGRDGRPAPAGLLPPGQQRAILSALCRSPAGTGAIDVDELVERIARREPVRRLPLRAAPTTRRGVQVLVDFGEGMRPFVRDQRDVVRALERLAGPDGFEVLRFSGTPLDQPGAGPGPVWTWRTYRPPLAGQPVIVLSDLGAGTPQPDGTDQRWMAFAALLRAAGNQVVALAPVPANRFSAALRAALPIVTWDRTARVADAVLAAGRSTRRVQGRSR
jgi:hypothetical protein